MYFSSFFFFFSFFVFLRACLRIYTMYGHVRYLVERLALCRTNSTVFCSLFYFLSPSLSLSFSTGSFSIESFGRALLRFTSMYDKRVETYSKRVFSCPFANYILRGKIFLPVQLGEKVHSNCNSRLVGAVSLAQFVSRFSFDGHVIILRSFTTRPFSQLFLNVPTIRHRFD